MPLFARIKGARAKTVKSEPRFQWNDCSAYPVERRMFLKDEALDVAARTGEHLISHISNALSHMPGFNDAVGSIIGRDDLQECVTKLVELQERNRSFRTYVGALGITGSGKSTAINALLREPELLPTSNFEAETSVPIIVEYNFDNDPHRAYHAEVFFRSRSEISNQLATFFQDVRKKNELQREDPLTLTSDDLHALHDATASLKPTFEMIDTVWGISNNDAERMDSEAILFSSKAVLRLFGTTERFHHALREDFITMIHPYMNSDKVGHAGSSHSFSVWPLIDHVKLYVKSDLLRGGLGIIDSPGSGDVMESRSAVARKYSNEVDTTLVFAPAKRAADEKISSKLISDHQELKLKMSGTFNSKSLCIVISQIDELGDMTRPRLKDSDANIALQNCLSEKRQLKADIRKLQEERHDITKQLRLVPKPSKNPRPQAYANSKNYKVHKSRNTDARLSAKSRLRVKSCNLTEEIDRRNHECGQCEANMIFICVRERNQLLKARFQQDIQKRQAATRTRGQHNLQEGSVSIHPISALAFEACEHGEPLMGFPSTEYSGIPQLAQWIRMAATKDREPHVESLLHEYHVLFNRLLAWSKEDSGQTKLALKYDEIMGIFNSIGARLKTSMNQRFKVLERQVRQLNPLNHRHITLKNFQEKCRGAIQSWDYKYPDQVGSSEKMHCLTYFANINREGGIFTSRAKVGMTYHWNYDIAAIVLRNIVDSWSAALHRHIPALSGPANEEISLIWEDAIQALLKAVKSQAPQLFRILEYESSKLDFINTQVKDRIQTALESISRRARNAHTRHVEVVHNTLRPIFKKAQQLQGIGKLRRAQALLSRIPVQYGTSLKNKAFEDLNEILNENLDRLLGDLMKTANDAEDLFRSHFSMVLNNVLVPVVEHRDAAARKARLQREVGAALTDCRLQWTMPGIYQQPKPEDCELPREYHAVGYDDSTSGEQDGMPDES
ncbi:uncharacterized protein JN550_013570 [Neoarthrinium moseri]|uniref:uncharacterized protein n=1 Tax=Neoarthrinium moseri TaxID=1658444 RepID=UPI001FDE4B17|nr:uncharacterized protein JN550_013570 [Neoarthrinium moseri]KAI1856934.1 hypothetical protein JN550_013570 [Neoarthrinium moseri]